MMNKEAYDFGYSAAAGQAAYEAQQYAIAIAIVVVLALLFFLYLYFDDLIQRYKDKKRDEKRRIERRKLKKRKVKNEVR